MPNRKGISKLITPFLIRNRWAIIPVIILIVFSLGAFEHYLFLMGGADLHLYYDVIVYAITLPLGSWILLNLLRESEVHRGAAEMGLNARQNLSRRLSDAEDLNALLHRIVEFPRELIPQATASLFLYDPEFNTFHLRAASTPDGQVILDQDRLKHGDFPQSLGTAQICDNPAILKSLEENRPIQLPALYIPFNHQGKSLGALRLDFPAGVELTPQTLSLLHSSGDEIATAIEGIHLQNLARNRAAASEDERRKIARDLHDSLAQNIGYLRLKLDQLTGEQSVLEITSILHELSRMRDIANEAYQQVRSTLDQLNYSSEKDLVAALENHARVVGERANFEVVVNQIGTPHYIPASVRRQMLLIAREGLSNIEKHAKASCVNIFLAWHEQDVVLRIIDNGAGYDSQKTTPTGHYGLMIMQERAHEVDGYLAVNSTPGKGTEVSLRIPISSTASAES